MECVQPTEINPETSDDNKLKKCAKRRWRCGTVALREIKKMTKTTDRQFPKVYIP
jgi:hypothetical protein